MSRIRMDIASVVVGGGAISSVVVLKPHAGEHDVTSVQLPIRIGTAEASSMSAAIAHVPLARPLTHDLLARTIHSLGARVVDVTISRVEGTTFFAVISFQTSAGDLVAIDARPSDAIALALRVSAPIFVEGQVLETCSYPDFGEVRKESQDEQLADFHDFLENLSPQDFS